LKTLQFTTLSFDVSFQEIFTTWSSGGELVLVSESTHRDPAELSVLMRACDVTRLFLPPVALHQLVESANRETTPALCEVIAAGEPLQVTRKMAAFFNGLVGARLVNHYGPSETHVVTEHVLEGAPERWPMQVPIGRPITNTRIYILDAELAPVPIGVVGELYISGASLARGYLGRPDLTATGFVPDSHSSDPGDRMYRTGDLGRFRPDGTIELRGRIDEQIKIRGHRVEPGEVVAVLKTYPALRHVAVAARKDHHGDNLLVAYYVDRDERFNPESMRQFMAERLPAYMVPSLFMAVESIPTTPSGKTDFRALPDPPPARPGLSNGYVAPRNEIETALVEIWADVLGLERVGIHDDFFVIGGHSLRATQVMSRLQATMGIEIPVSRIFEAPTVAGLGLLVAHALAAECDEDTVAEILQRIEGPATELGDHGRNHVESRC
jgi:acyl-CoA synthetase (AMP-forming)/AMP-acid ligase II/acyl carrier protein